MKPEDLLPAQITSITPQKNNRDRYSLFVDKTFLLGVDADTLLKHQLKKDMEITFALFKKLQRDEGRNDVKNYLLKLLGYREHARQELFNKAKRKNYASEIIEDVLYELKQKDFIDDQHFAQKYASDKSSSNKWGPRKITAHLRKKGVEHSTAQRAADQAFEQVDFNTRFKKLIFKRQKRLLREENKLKRKQKAVNYLLQKGYNSHNVFKHIDPLLEQLEAKK